MKAWNLVVAAAALAVASACGGVSPGAANEAACKRFIEKVKCGSVDLTSSYSCSSYAQLNCDISAYFDCVGSAYVCTNGMYDTTKLASAAACAPKSTCN